MTRTKPVEYLTYASLTTPAQYLPDPDLACDCGDEHWGECERRECIEKDLEEGPYWGAVPFKPPTLITRIGWWLQDAVRSAQRILRTLLGVESELDLVYSRICDHEKDLRSTRDEIEGQDGSIEELATAINCLASALDLLEERIPQKRAKKKKAAHHKSAPYSAK